MCLQGTKEATAELTKRMNKKHGKKKFFKVYKFLPKENTFRSPWFHQGIDVPYDTSTATFEINSTRDQKDCDEWYDYRDCSYAPFNSGIHVFVNEADANAQRFNVHGHWDGSLVKIPVYADVHDLVAAGTFDGQQESAVFMKVTMKKSDYKKALELAEKKYGS